MSNKKTKGVMLLLVVAVILMTVGFAAYAQRLTINGNVTVKGSPWDVRYDVTKGVTENHGTATSKSLTDTDFTFAVTLEKPGDYYEATFDVKNFGSMTAYLKAITMSSISAHSAYLSYTITYDGVEYTSSQSGLTGKSIAADGSKTVKVKVTYLAPASSSSLPTSDVNVTVTGSFDYSSED